MSWNIFKEKITDLDFPLQDLKIYKSNNVDPIEDDIDFAIIFNSCESRAIEYFNLFHEKQIKSSLLVDFKSDNPLKECNMQANKDNLSQFTINNTVELCDIDIFNFHNNINTIISKIPREAITLGAKWFMDITGVPCIYSIALVKLIKRLFPSPELILLNVSGKYTESSNAMNYFSEGFQEDTWVPLCEGEPDYSKPWEYIFLLGFEGERGLRIYKTNEPSSCKLVVANPGYSETDFKQSLQHNNGLMHEIGFNESDIIEVDAGDIIRLVEIIQKRYLEISDSKNLCIAPLGPKPHAIAASIVSIMNNEISVMYQVPSKYILKDIAVPLRSKIVL